MKSKELISEFVTKYASVAFRHADEVIKLLTNPDSSSFDLNVYTARIDSHMRWNYRYRAQRCAEAGEQLLAEDAAALATVLEQVPDQPIRAWNVVLPDGVVYLIFELMDEQRIAGCMLTRDARIDTR